MNTEIQGFKSKESLTAPTSGQDPFPEGSYVLGPWVPAMVGESHEQCGSGKITPQLHMRPPLCLCLLPFFLCWYQLTCGYPLLCLLISRGISALLKVLGNGELGWTSVAGDITNEQPLRSSVGPFPSLKSAPTRLLISCPLFTRANERPQCSAGNCKFELLKPWLLVGKLWSKHQSHLDSPRASMRCVRKHKAKQNRTVASLSPRRDKDLVQIGTQRL